MPFQKINVDYVQLYKALQERDNVTAIRLIKNYISNNINKAIENDCEGEIMQTLLDLDSPVDADNQNMITPFLANLKIGLLNHLEFIEELLRYNININCFDFNLMTSLHFACQAQNLKVVAVLLNNGANPNAKNNKNQTPLHMVFDDYFGYGAEKEPTSIILNIIELLLRHNANLEAEDTRGWTPLFLACKSSKSEIVKYFLDHGADANHTDLEKETPLHITVTSQVFKKREIVQLLLEHKANVHCVNKRGKSIIHLEAQKVPIHSNDFFKRLVQTQVNLNSVDNEGDTPLHIAIEKGSEGTIKCLIKYGANINKLDKKNRTPLQKAIEYASYHRKKLEDHDFIHQWFELEGVNSEDYDPEWPEINYSYKLFKVYPYEKMIRVIKMHIVKLKTAGLKVSEQNLNLFYKYSHTGISDNEYTDEESLDEELEDSKTDILELGTRCEREIKKMKMESIGVSGITFYDLLTENIHRFGKNKEIYETLNKKIYSEKFPLYINIIKSRFRDAKFRYKTINLAEEYFYLHVCDRLPDHCIDVIFSFLKFRDINMFIRAMKPLNE